MNQIGNLTPDHKSLESKSQMMFNWAVLYTIGNIFLKVIGYFLQIFKKYLISKNMRPQNFGTIIVPILGVPGKSDIKM